LSREHISASSLRGYLWISPAAAMLILVLALPMIYSLKASFTASSLLSPGSEQDFVGWSNYWQTLTDPEYRMAVVTTVAYAILAVSIELVLGTFVALMLNETFFLTPVLRSAWIVPMVVTPAIVGLFWILLYDETHGIFNYALVKLGFSPVPWLDVNHAFTSIVIMDVWQSTPFFALVMLAGLQSRNEEILEAARVDGASPLQCFYYLTISHLMPYMLIASSFRIIAAMGDFDKIYMLTAGGPGLVTTTLSIQTYKVGFNTFDIGRTAAMAWLFLLIVLIISGPLICYLGKTSDAER